jgi:hypothetical protein
VASRLSICFFLVLFFVQTPETEARQSAAIQTGFLKIVPDSQSTSPSGLAILKTRATGVLISETPVPSSTTIDSGRVFVDIGGAFNTALAFANPSNEEAQVSFYFTDPEGHDFGAGSYSLLPNHQIAAFLTDAPFGLKTSLTGTFTFSASRPIAALAIRSFTNERREMLMTTMPIAALGNDTKSKTLLFPRFEDKGTSSIDLVMVNPTDTALNGTVQFFGRGSAAAGAFPVNVLVNGLVNSSFKYSIPPKSFYKLRRQPTQNDVEIGSVRVSAGATATVPASMAIISRLSRGMTVSSTSVSSSIPAQSFRMYIERAGVFGQAQSLQTGISISNPSTGGVTVQLNLMQLDGTSTGLSTSIDIAAGGEISTYLNEVFPELAPTFKGVLKVSSSSGIAVGGLRGRYNERGEFLISATPAYDDRPAASSEVYVPHVLMGGGYSTELVLLSPGTAQGGSMWLLSQDGLPMDGVNLTPAH